MSTHGVGACYKGTLQRKRGQRQGSFARKRRLRTRHSALQAGAESRQSRTGGARRATRYRRAAHLAACGPTPFGKRALALARCRWVLLYIYR